MDIVYIKKDVIVGTRTKVGKSLIYKTISLINLRAIILTITLTITLMKGQERELKQKNISALALTAAAIKVDPNIWKWLEQKKYSVIFASPNIVFAP